MNESVNCENNCTVTAAACCQTTVNKECCDSSSPPSASAPVRNIGGIDVKRVTPKIKTRNAIPEELLLNEDLNAAIAILPANYNFEMHKVIWKIQSDKTIKRVSLQFPEGLLMYACVISDIIRRFAGARVNILGDVTYGACCIDDFTASKLGADLLVHYGHSCLVPITTTSRIKIMYVFVEIRFDPSHLILSLQRAFSAETRIALMGTIQFTGVLGSVEKALRDGGFLSVVIPQARPLSAGETLGCTAPVLPECDALVFVADGRFHLEAAMIRNPTVPAYRYDPYSKLLTSEAYDITAMKKVRWEAIQAARSPNAVTFGLILGTLGRQGSPSIWSRLRTLLSSRGKVVVPFLMAEINRVKLANVREVDIWVQVACPRLSIDWGATGGGPDGGDGDGDDGKSPALKPILTPYELEVALGEAEWQSVYPMDFYSNDGGPWGNMAHRK